MYNLTFCYWTKGESEYLPEWIEFHLLQGVDHFVIFENHGCHDNTFEILLPYLKAGILEIRRYPPHITQRSNFYIMEKFTQEQIGVTKFLHYGAPDERVISIDPSKTLPEVLQAYVQFGGVSVAWEEFNANGKAIKEPGLIIERFTTTAKDTACHIKTIVRPETVVNHCGNPHNFIFKPGFGAVDENFNPVRDAWNPKNYSFNKIKNHHFTCMSKEEFEIKQNKGLLDHAGQENIRRIHAEQQWTWLNEQAEQASNTELLKYVEPVKNALRDRYKDYPDLLKLVAQWYNL